jgi:hypothetical protein
LFDQNYLRRFAAFFLPDLDRFGADLRFAADRFGADLRFAAFLARFFVAIEKCIIYLHFYG